MIEIVKTGDAELVKAIITHPKIYPFVTEDGAPAPEVFSVRGLVDHPGIHFLAPIADDQVAGVFMVHSETPSIYVVHTCILPEFWGRAEEAGRELIRWVFQNTKCNKLVTYVPKDNRLAYRLAIAVGMQEQGCITESYMKNGVLIDQHVLGIGRRQVCP